MGKRKVFVLTVGVCTFAVLLGLWIKALRNCADSIPYAVIGGADGPTAIFVTSQNDEWLLYSVGAILVLLFAIFVFIYFKALKARHKM